MMKSEHRHELKTNELAEWLINFPQWAKENLRMIIYISVLVVVVAGLYFWKAYKKNVVDFQKKTHYTGLLGQLSASKHQILAAKAQGQDISFMLIQLANNLGQCAETTKNNTMAALALIKSAEATRSELLYRQMVAVSPQDVVNQINNAKNAYNKALQKSVSNPSLRALAKYGLGLCEEELGNFKQAKEIYQGIVKDPSLEYTTAFHQTKFRLDVMDEYKTKFAFRPAPKEEVLKPSIEVKGPELKIPDTNKVAKSVPGKDSNSPFPPFLEFKDPNSNKVIRLVPVDPNKQPESKPAPNAPTPKPKADIIVKPAEPNKSS
ncbi:MAG: YfgM family protein [Planctomycetota bacterium]|jgi:tetratricopeptide (TPR) repeat protein